MVVFNRILDGFQKGDLNTAYKYLSIMSGCAPLPSYLLKKTMVENPTNEYITRYLNEKKGHDASLTFVEPHFEKYAKRFPEEVYVLSNGRICPFKTGDLFKFKYMRNLFIKEWNLLEGTNFDPKPMGQQDCPFNITPMNIAIHHLEIVCALMKHHGEEDQEVVGNLTKDVVRECDNILDKLGLDFGR